MNIVDHRCLECEERLRCPECNSYRLNKQGWQGRKQQYICRGCGKITAKPICQCPPKPSPAKRELSPDGSWCYTCEAPCQNCPECGESLMRPMGYRYWSLRDGSRVRRRIFQCLMCYRYTTRPACACDLPYLSEKARKKLHKGIIQDAGHGL